MTRPLTNKLLADEPLAAMILLALLFPAPRAEAPPQAVKGSKKPALSPARANRALGYGGSRASLASWSDRP